MVSHAFYFLFRNSVKSGSNSARRKSRAAELVGESHDQSGAPAGARREFSKRASRFEKTQF
jgi:hypothetical protein